MTFDRDKFSELYPFESHWHERDGHRMHYLDEGEGPATVMVHGNPTWSFYYRDLVKAFSGSRRCIVPDHIGCGLSDKPPETDYHYTLKSRIDDLESLLNSALDPAEKVTLILHDWGGAIGMGWATRHPERVERIVLLNTAAFFLPETKPLPWSLKLIRNTPLGRALVLRMNAFAVGATRTAVVRPLPPLVRDGFVAPYDSPANRIATYLFVKDIPLDPKDEAYPVIEGIENGLAQFANTPVLVCWGDKDFVFDSHFLRVWRERWPHAEVHQYPDAGHYVIEDKTPEVIAKIQNFFAAEDGR